MLFRRRQTRPLGGGLPAGSAEQEAPGGHVCPSLTKVVDKVFRLDKPRILDLGPLCGPSVTYFAARGARVTVDEFTAPVDPPPAEDGGEEPRLPLIIPQPDESFDLVLAWERVDFIAPDRLAEFGAELRRILAPGGWLLMFSKSKLDAERDQIGRFRLDEEDHVSREPVGGPRVRRWAHPTRDIERALHGLSIQGIHLQRDQTREFLAKKRVPGQPRRR